MVRLNTLSILACLLAGGLLASPAGAQTLAGDPADQIIGADFTPLALDIGGRVVETSFAKTVGDTQFGGPAYEHQWPGVYFAAAFHGSEVDFKLEDAANHYDVLVDGTLVGQVSKPGNAEYQISGLADSDHVVRLEKTSESQAATGQFDGFFIPPGEGALPAPLQSRQIEFIGDSYTVGSGNTSTSHTCTPDQLWATTDTAKAFALQVARHYDAEYRINAYSGRGVVRNYDGVVPEAPLPVLYPYALFDGKSEAMAAEWHPQVILIALGTNDFSTPVHAGEKWADLATLRADYIVSYVAFIQKLREHNPAAQILLLAYDDPEVTADIEEVATEVRANGDTRVDTIDAAGPLAKTGCDGHPSTDDDVKIVGVIEAYIDSYPTIWGCAR